jgi:hypothetical protein
MPRRLITGGLAVLALWPASAGAAGPSSLYNSVLHAYQTGGSVPPCRFSSQQLETALGDVDTYGQQYYADFIAAIQTALAARASGTCSKTHRLTTPVSGGQASGGPRLPASVTASTSSGVPAPLVVLGIAAAVLACAAVLAALVGRRGAPAEWRHGWAEARYRAGGIWSGRRRR